MEHFNVPHSLPKRPRSLFREIKLKERKILDHLTSDGESAGTSGLSQSDNDDILSVQNIYDGSPHKMFLNLRKVENYSPVSHKEVVHSYDNVDSDVPDHFTTDSVKAKMCRSSILGRLRDKIQSPTEPYYSPVQSAAATVKASPSRISCSSADLPSHTSALTISANSVDNVSKDDRLGDEQYRYVEDAGSTSTRSQGLVPAGFQQSLEHQQNHLDKACLAAGLDLSGTCQALGKSHSQGSFSQLLASSDEQMDTQEQQRTEGNTHMPKYPLSFNTIPTQLPGMPSMVYTASEDPGRTHSMFSQTVYKTNVETVSQPSSHVDVQQRNQYSPVFRNGIVPTSMTISRPTHVIQPKPITNYNAKYNKEMNGAFSRKQLGAKMKSELDRYESRRDGKKAIKGNTDAEFESFTQQLKQPEGPSTFPGHGSVWGQTSESSKVFRDNPKEAVSYQQPGAGMQTMVCGNSIPSVQHSINLSHGSVVQTPDGLAYIAPMVVGQKPESFNNPGISQPASIQKMGMPVVNQMYRPVEQVGQNPPSVQFMQVPGSVLQPVFLQTPSPQTQQHPELKHPQQQVQHLQQQREEQEGNNSLQHQHGPHTPGRGHRNCQMFLPRPQQPVPNQPSHLAQLQQQQTLPKQVAVLQQQQQQQQAKKPMVCSNYRASSSQAASSKSSECGSERSLASTMPELQEGMVLDPVSNIPGMCIQTVTEGGQIELERRDIIEGMMMCLICEDRATGLHYGIITCEGCKGFFKRTVQNKRIYTCTSGEDCEVIKSQRNRCQFCRFKKCIQKGMVIAAVREDRMPGGRNSGAVYNMFKFKYKRHRKKTSPRDLPRRGQSETSGSASDHADTSSVSDLIVRTHNPQAWIDDIQNFNLSDAQSPSKGQSQGQRQGHTQGQGQGRTQRQIQSQTPVQYQGRTQAHTRGQLQGEIQSHTQGQTQHQSQGQTQARAQEVTDYQAEQSSDVNSLHSKDSVYTSDKAVHLLLIEKNIQCECFRDITRFAYRVEYEPNVMQMLSNLGSDIVNHLVRWAQKLPFFSQMPMSSHLHILTNKWHEVLFLTTAAYQTIVDSGRNKNHHSTRPHQDEFKRRLNKNFRRLHAYMTLRLRQNITMQNLQKEVQTVMESVTSVIHNFGRLKVTLPEYTCLKVILLLNLVGEERTPTVADIQQQYMDALEAHTSLHHPESANRFGELILLLTQVQSAAALLLQSRMIFVPFLLSNLAKEHQVEAQ